jgi:DNA adenine methylase
MELINSLKKHKNEKNYYYKTREKDRNPTVYNNMTIIEKASRIAYLNRCCYNGLYRVNSKGHFNVPFGKYKNPNFCDEENLIAANRALKTVEILACSFEKCLEYVKKGDFVYFDPPYFPISETSSFTSYTKDSFGKESQISLNKVFKELDKIGCKVALSNSNSNFIRSLYKDYRIVELLAKRAINCNGEKRGEIKELFITNGYED